VRLEPDCDPFAVLVRCRLQCRQSLGVAARDLRMLRLDDLKISADHEGHQVGRKNRAIRAKHADKGYYQPTMQMKKFEQAGGRGGRGKRSR
jgi:hypothetical protein